MGYIIPSQFFKAVANSELLDRISELEGKDNPHRYSENASFFVVYSLEESVIWYWPTYS